MTNQMPEYHKIQSVYKRDPKQNNKRFIIGDWSLPEFCYLQNNEWEWTEKVDGTNVRIGWDGEHVTIGGRTDDAQMPLFLVRRLEELFPRFKMRETFNGPVTLYGEGYGAKIQKVGGLYKPDGVDFILFDILAGNTWLRRQDVEGIASQLGLGWCPVIGRGTLLEAIEHVKEPRKSPVGTGDAPSEGLVMRPTIELNTRMGSRVIAKVKHRDFV